MPLADALLDLQELTRRLRRECPWDREQTAATIAPHTLEEAYEVVDAVQGGDPAKLRDELGDLLFQVYFLALLLEEQEAGDLEAVARSIHEKLVRRHPHVFGEADVRTASRVRERWEQIKTEQEGREGTFHQLPDALPALTYARKAGRRAATVGFDYASPDDALVELADELEELRAAIATAGAPSPESEPDPRVFDELGDVLFAAVNLGRHVNVEPELALRATVRRFVDRVEEAERLAAADGEVFAELPLARQDRYFDRAKEIAR
jgi:XTP/dITP diphosphohydrolase/tetrapyrrole methylase family protein/MazG family protein/ATP diphosphatase